MLSIPIRLARIMFNLAKLNKGVSMLDPFADMEQYCRKAF